MHRVGANPEKTLKSYRRLSVLARYLIVSGVGALSIGETHLVLVLRDFLRFFPNSVPLDNLGIVVK